MWEQNLGVKINIENLEPDRAKDEIDAGHHGQLLAYGWCADYPDPENFADALFYTGSENNLGHYSNPALDTLLEKARVERGTTVRLGMYKEAEKIIVDDAPAIFLNYNMSYTLIKPYIKGYTHVPLSTVPFYRWLSIDPSQLK
jgi:ABC-type oligopeptide transport system substrate-binding subunit